MTAADVVSRFAVFQGILLCGLETSGPDQSRRILNHKYAHNSSQQHEEASWKQSRLSNLNHSNTP